ncbi:hypothetical protein AYO47_08910 [Planctomyces sp. SCGC AG-212-M04]|nr:hypothetical protein AYO47_08910 [Planctomyces sp. SCGC AG-212-M04]
MVKSADRWGVLLLVGAVLSAALLCGPALRGQALALDEHVSYYCSGAPSVLELWNRCSDAAVLPPLSHLFERAAVSIGGRSESAFRAPSLLAYLLSVPVAWWIGRFLGGPIAGGVAAMIVAWQPEMLDEVRFARCYGLVLLLSSLSTGFVLRWRQRPEQKWWAGAWALSAAGLCWTHYLAGPLVAAQAVMMVVVVLRHPPSQQRRIGMAPLVAIVAVGLSCIPLLPAVARLREWSGLIEYQRVPATIWDAFGARWTLAAIAVLAVSSAWRRFRTSGRVETSAPLEEQPPEIGWPVFLWLVPLAVIGTMAVVESPMLASPRYRVMAVCPSAVALGLALSRAFRPTIAILGAAGVLALSTFLHGTSPRVAGRLANVIEEEWKRVGLELRSRIDDPHVLVFTQTGLAEGVLLPAMSGSERFRKYVGCRLGGFYTGSERALPIPFLWNGGGRLREEYRTLLDANAVREAWIVGANDTDLNAESLPVFSQFLEFAGFQQVGGEESRPGITMLRFERRVGGNLEE